MKENSILDLDIKEILLLFLKRWWLILLCAILCATLGYLYCSLTTSNSYQSSAYVYVNTSYKVGTTSFTISSGDISTSSKIIDIYSAILPTKTICEIILEQAGLENKYSPSQVAGMISIASVNDTPVLKILVTCGDPDDARKICSAILDTLSDQIPKIIDGSSISPFDYPTTPTEPLSRGFKKYALIGMIAGIVLSCAGIFLVEYVINDTIQSEEWLQNTFGENIPLLATIPNTQETSSRKYGYYQKYAHYAYAHDPSENEGGTK